MKLYEKATHFWKCPKSVYDPPHPDTLTGILSSAPRLSQTSSSSHPTHTPYSHPSRPVGNFSEKLFFHRCHGTPNLSEMLGLQHMNMGLMWLPWEASQGSFPPKYMYLRCYRWETSRDCFLRVQTRVCAVSYPCG